MPSPSRTDAIVRAAIAQRFGLFTVGNIWYVDSGHAQKSDVNGYGKSPSTPFATLDFAIGQATASNGDVIVVAPGHTETISAAGGITVDVAGLTIVGQGIGSDKPTITLGTATTATFLISSNNTTVFNLRFVSAIDSLVKFIDVNADYTLIEDCNFVTSSALEATSFINIRTTKDYLKVYGCRFEQPTDPAGSDGGADTGGIYMVDTEYVHIRDCMFVGNFETACIHNKTTAAKYIVAERCYFYQALSGAEPFQLVTAAIGVAKECFCHTPAEAAATEATLFGTLGDAFFIAASSSGGNDGAAGGQGGIVATAAS